MAQAAAGHTFDDLVLQTAAYLSTTETAFFCLTSKDQSVCTIPTLELADERDS